MSKQEWEKRVKNEFGEYPSMKFHQENGVVTLAEVAEWDKIINFLYSLHQLELRGIREMIEAKGHQQEDDSIWCNMDEILDDSLLTIAE